MTYQQHERIKRHLAKIRETIAKAQETERRLLIEMETPIERKKPQYRTRSCQSCGAEFSPRGPSSMRCDPCKAQAPAPKPKTCRRCGEGFIPADRRATICTPCRMPPAKPLPVTQRTCGNCQHGYQHAPGEYACAIAAGMRCKPALVSRHWMARQAIRGGATA